MAAQADPQGRAAFMLTRKRTWWDVVLGVLIALAGIVILGHVALASLVSILFMAWFILFAGLLAIVWAVAAWGEPGHWWGIVTGGALAVLGIVMLRNPGESLLVFTLLAGALLIVAGLTRIVAGFQAGAPRGLLLVSGAVTLLLGVLILFEFPLSAAWYLGVVLGVSMLIDGLSAAIVGRYRPVALESSAGSG